MRTYLEASRRQRCLAYHNSCSNRSVDLITRVIREKNLDVVHERDAGFEHPMASDDQIFKARSVQNLCRSVANFLHNAADTARHLIDAFITTPVGRLANARKQSKRPVEGPNQLA